MAEVPQSQKNQSQPQPKIVTIEPPVRLAPPLPPDQPIPIGKKSTLMLFIAFLFFVGGLGTWVYVEYFFK
ncbi:MAG: hypothetical protein O3B87_03355 [bacterium]|nr:hypothetical protein [bacterium]